MPTATTTPTQILDRRGKTITTYVVFDAAQQLDSMHEGDVLDLLTDDFEPFQHDLPAWCHATGHRVIETEVIAHGRRPFSSADSVDDFPGRWPVSIRC